MQSRLAQLSAKVSKGGSRLLYTPTRAFTCPHAEHRPPPSEEQQLPGAQVSQTGEMLGPKVLLLYWCFPPPTLVVLSAEDPLLSARVCTLLSRALSGSV